MIDKHIMKTIKCVQMLGKFVEKIKKINIKTVVELHQLYRKVTKMF